MTAGPADITDPNQLPTRAAFRTEQLGSVKCLIAHLADDFLPAPIPPAHNFCANRPTPLHDINCYLKFNKHGSKRLNRLLVSSLALPSSNTTCLTKNY